MEFYVILSILAAGFALFGVNVLRQARRTNRESEGAWYSISQRDMRRKALLLNLQAAALLLTAAGLFVWLLVELPQAVTSEDNELAVPRPSSTPLIPEPSEAFTEQPPNESTAVITPTLRAVLTPTASEENGTPLVPIPTIPLTSEAVITKTNGGGLWLRDEPFGNGLILLPEGSIVFVRGGFVEVSGVLWQAVVDPEGREGWVAADYLIYR
jgi:hypothetical protein